MLARTLTQAALPSTVGREVRALADRRARRRRTARRRCAALPVQVGGAVGTLAAAIELAGSVDGAIALSDALAAALGLAPAPPWHTTRSPITRIGDALVTCCDAWGHLAADVATGSRPEIGEFAEGDGGGSSTMPHKNNPVRSVLIRRAALTAGPLAATLHTAAARQRRRTRRRRLARRVGHPADPGPAHRRRRRPHHRLLTGLRVDAAPRGRQPRRRGRRCCPSSAR